MKRRFFPGLAYVFALCAIICEFIKIIIEEYDMSVLTDSLMVMGPALYIVLYIFLNKERGLSSVLIICAAFSAACYIAVAYLDAPESFAGYAAFFLVVILCAYSAANAAMKPVEVGQLLTIMDVSFAALIIMGFMVNYRGVSIVNCIILVAAAVVSLGGLIIARLDRSLDAKDILGFGVLFAGIGAVVSFLVAFAAEPAGNGLVAVVTAIKSAVVFVGKKIGAFLIYLLSLIKAPESGPVENMAGTASVSTDEINAAETALPDWIWIIPVILIIVAFVIVVFAVRKMKIKTTASGKLSASENEKTSFFGALRRAIGKLRLKMKCRSYLKKNGSTPLGLFYSLVEICRRTPAEKKCGETAKEFLTRLSCSQQEAEDAEFLSELSAKVNAALYAKMPSSEILDPAYCRNLLERIRRSSREKAQSEESV